MGIKWLDKSHRSPVSCKEISREQVANRLQSRCKQGFSSIIYNSINNIETAILVWLLIILSGDVETNPGPDSYREHCVSILHCNIRSTRNKIEYIVDNFCDFDCLCFTESHLDNSVDNSNILLTNEFSVPYRKDRTYHGGGI